MQCSVIEMWYENRRIDWYEQAAGFLEMSTSGFCACIFLLSQHRPKTHKICLQPTTGIFHPDLLAPDEPKTVIYTTSSHSVPTHDAEMFFRELRRELHPSPVYCAFSAQNRTQKYDPREGGKNKNEKTHEGRLMMNAT